MSDDQLLRSTSKGIRSGADGGFGRGSGSGSGSEDGLSNYGKTSARASMYNILRSLVRNNVEYFAGESGEGAERFLATFCLLEEYLDQVEPQADSIRRVAPEFDVDERTPANGYRSFVFVVDTCVLHCIRVAREICVHRSSFLFRSGHYHREIDAFTATMGSLKIGLHHLQTLYSWSQPGSLFPDEQHSPEELLLETEGLDQCCFYGRCLAFQVD